MTEDFDDLNDAVVDEFNEEVEHLAYGENVPVTVQVIRVDPATLNDVPAGAFLILFASRAVSGFESDPAKGDEFIVDGETFRCNQTRQDQTGGLYIFLNK